MDYFQIIGTLERGQHFFHIAYDFFIDEPPENLSVSFNYDPFWGDKSDPKHIEAIRDAAHAQLQLNDPEKIQTIIENAMPLKNGITIAISDPQGFRGEDHKMIPNRRITLSEFASSPCFSNRVNIAGKYKILLHVYNIVTDSCQYKINVSDGKS